MRDMMIELELEAVACQRTQSIKTYREILSVIDVLKGREGG